MFQERTSRVHYIRIQILAAKKLISCTKFILITLTTLFMPAY